MWVVWVVVEWMISEVEIIGIHGVQVVLIDWLWWSVLWMSGLEISFTLWSSLHVLSFWGVCKITVWEDDMVMVIWDWTIIIYWLWSGKVEMMVCLFIFVFMMPVMIMGIWLVMVL